MYSSRSRPCSSATRGDSKTRPTAHEYMLRWPWHPIAVVHRSGVGVFAVKTLFSADASARDPWMPITDTVRFLGAFLRNPMRVGAIAPSSPALARAMVAGLRVEPGESIL